MPLPLRIAGGAAGALDHPCECVTERSEKIELPWGSPCLGNDILAEQVLLEIIGQ